VAQVNSQAEEKRFAMMQDDNSVTADQRYRLQEKELDEKIRQFDAKMKQEREKQDFEKAKHRDDMALKRRQAGAGQGK